MIKLPLLQAQDPVVNRYQVQLNGALQPIVTNNAAAAQQVMVNGSALVSLKSGQVNTIPIGLSQPLQGWFITRLLGNAVIWDSQASNSTPNSTLSLNTSADVQCSIMVF
jgi:hypothetical protein